MRTSSFDSSSQSQSTESSRRFCLITSLSEYFKVCIPIEKHLKRLLVKKKKRKKKKEKRKKSWDIKFHKKKGEKNHLLGVIEKDIGREMI